MLLVYCVYSTACPYSFINLNRKWLGSKVCEVANEVHCHSSPIGACSSPDRIYNQSTLQLGGYRVALVLLDRIEVVVCMNFVHKLNLLKSISKNNTIVIDSLNDG